MKKIIKTVLFAFLAIVLIVALSNSTKSTDTEPSTQPAVTTAQTEAPAATTEAFTVEHDDEYYKTQEYIYKFLTEKGYEVQTIIGVPNIGRYEDADPNDNYVGWYAFIKRNGEWEEFVVLLYHGEVTSMMPKQ